MAAVPTKRRRFWSISSQTLLVLILEFPCFDLIELISPSPWFDLIALIFESPSFRLLHAALGSVCGRGEFAQKREKGRRLSDEQPHGG
jgi:hypothetical protein